MSNHNPAVRKAYFALKKREGELVAVIEAANTELEAVRTALTAMAPVINAKPAPPRPTGAHRATPPATPAAPATKGGHTANGGQDGRERLTDAAARLLQEVGRPLHVNDITRMLQERGNRTDYNYNAFLKTMIGVLARSARDGDKVIRIGSGTYDLIGRANGGGAREQRDGGRAEAPDAAPDQGEPTLTDRILAVIAEAPGIRSSQVAARLGYTTGPQIKVVQTIISQQIGKGRVRREDPTGWLYLVGAEKDSDLGRKA